MEEKELKEHIDETELEHPDFDLELVKLLRSDLSEQEKKDRLTDYHDSDIADAIEQLTQQERTKLYALLGTEEISQVFAYLDDAGEYLEEMDVEAAADVIENMDADDAVDILLQLDDDKQQAIISRMDEESRSDIELIRSYDEDEVGSRMTTNYISIRRGSSVKQAMRSLMEQAAENDNLMTIYVENDDGSFYGAITLQDLIIAREHTDLEDLISTNYPYIYATESVSDCIEQLKDYSEDSIPVLDSDKKLLGVITSQDLVEAVDEQLGDDYAKLAGLTSEEDLNEPLVESLKKRIPWLLVLMALGMVVSSVVGLFEPVMAQLTIIVTFQSLILDMAGNAGTQSLAVTIRVLMDENLTSKEKLHHILKEGRVGITTGLLLGLICLVMVGLYIHFAKGYPFSFSFWVSGCASVAMLLAILIASLAGATIPMLLTKLKIDPAVASGPLITTINDLVAAVIYYGLAWILLINILHLAG